MHRREFLIQSSRAALGVSLLPMAGCATRKLTPVSTALPLGPLIPHLEHQLPVWMEESKVPGLSIALIHDAKVAWRRGFGVKDSASKAPVDTDTMFEAASMSKPVFAYFVLKLCEKGVLNLDTPLTKYTAERFVADDPRLDLITPRHVLSHATGFQNWRSRKEPLKIHFTPGERYRYSGEGYFYLQSVVTRLIGHVNPADCATFEAGLEVCATDIETHLKANLLVPLGMHSSGYAWNETFARRMARPHGPKGEPGDNKKSGAAAVARFASAGALLTTPDAYRLKRESLKEMLRPHVKLEGQYPSSWALGWQIFHNPKRDFIYHGGDNTGFHCGALASVEGKCGYVVMTNGDGGPEVLKKLVTDERVQEFLNG
jgi:CubicO group peptidase (beta-lactamase class C family)